MFAARCFRWRNSSSKGVNVIFYFSATGNSEHVARRIAAATGDDVCSIAECVKEGGCRFPASGAIGIVSPTYAWGLPSIVRDFLRRLELDGQPGYLWFCATFGTTPGQCGRFANEILQRKGLAFAAYFSVKTPDSWTPIFNLSDAQKVASINAAAEREIDAVIEQVQNRAVGDFMRRKAPVAVTRLVSRFEYESMRKTSHFRVEDTCIGCGLCAKRCPVSAIELRERRPVWVQDRCVMCLSCLHRCPKFAIQYGARTKHHGQYVHPGGN